VLVDNHGYASIGALSRSIGSDGFGTATGALPLDLAANAESLGARVVRAKTVEDLREALAGARGADGPVVVYVEADRYRGVPSYETWWDVPVAEVSEEDAVRGAREAYDRAHEQQRQYLRSTHD
jgi:3D-(3,5/4)-trihydroxycyclohexane-1,2-dione acylhydrolase (decyclizing)